MSFWTYPFCIYMFLCNCCNVENLCCVRLTIEILNETMFVYPFKVNYLFSRILSWKGCSNAFVCIEIHIKGWGTQVQLQMGFFFGKTKVDFDPGRGRVAEGSLLGHKVSSERLISHTLYRMDVLVYTHHLISLSKIIASKGHRHDLVKFVYNFLSNPNFIHQQNEAICKQNKHFQTHCAWNREERENKQKKPKFI